MPMEIDYGHMWDDLKEHLKTRRSWGSKTLIRRMDKMERDRKKPLAKILRERRNRRIL